MKLKTKRKAAASSQKYRGKQSYGIGGAVMTLGKNLLQGKKIGSGAFKGVLRAGITPGSGIGAGIGLAGALASKSKNPSLQKLGKGLGIAGNVAGMFTGGGGAGAGALGGLAGKFAGADKALHGLGKGMQGAGGVLPFLAQNVFKAEDGMKMPYAYGGKMKIMKEGGKIYDEGGKNRRNKKVELIEPMMDPSIFAADPYSASSMGRQVVDKMYNSGAGKVRGLESRLTFNPSSEQYTRTQLESSPAFLEKGGKVYDDGGSIEEIIGSLSKAELKELYQMLLNR